MRLLQDTHHKSFKKPELVMTQGIPKLIQGLDLKSLFPNEKFFMATLLWENFWNLEFVKFGLVQTLSITVSGPNSPLLTLLACLLASWHAFPALDFDNHDETFKGDGRLGLHPTCDRLKSCWSTHPNQEPQLERKRNSQKQIIKWVKARKRERNWVLSKATYETYTSSNYGKEPHQTFMLGSSECNSMTSISRKCLYFFFAIPYD